MRFVFITEQKEIVNHSYFHQLDAHEPVACPLYRVDKSVWLVRGYAPPEYKQLPPNPRAQRGCHGQSQTQTPPWAVRVYRFGVVHKVGE